MSSEPNRLILAILIPCYNCGASVLQVIEGCRAYTDCILTINDGSIDETEALLKQCGTLQLGWDVNKGKGFSLLQGFRYLLDETDADLIMTMDSDGQHDPSDIPALIKCMDDNTSDIVVGRRSFDVPNGPIIRRLANKYSSRFIAKLYHSNLIDLQSGFRLFKRDAIERLLPCVENTTFALETEMLLIAHKAGLSIHEVDIKSIYTAESSKRSSWRPLLDTWRIAKVVMRHLRD